MICSTTKGGNTMCGFVGYWQQDDVCKETIEKMANRIIHRGPDDAGYYVDENIAMGFRRLSIIDLEHGKQPMIDEKNQRVLTFNGEIYNYQDLKKELEALGYQFQTQVDSEVLLHGYDAWGEDLLSKLRGMFAFVIYDKKEKELFGARDHYGIKPFYYYHDNDTFLYGSEIKAFVEHPNFKPTLDIELLPVHLSFEYIPGDRTMFQHVHKLMPGHYFRLKEQQLTTQAYYHFEYNIHEDADLTQNAEQIKTAFHDSVEKHLIADVEVGSFLSSGVDSSYVLTEASRLQDIQTFSIGFEEEKYSELGFSTLLSKELNKKNTVFKLSADDYFDALPEIMYHMDEPLSNPSAIMLYFLSQGAAQSVKVVLSGEGADEFFGGYNTYQEAFPFQKYQRAVPSFVRKGLAKLVKNAPRFHGKRFLMRGAEPLSSRYYRVNYVFNRVERQELLKDPTYNLDTATLTKHLFEEVKTEDEVTQMQYFDIHTWLPHDILHKADRMSMAHSLEVRVPFVDKFMGELSATFPVRSRVTPTETKVALRKAAAESLPERVSQKEKLGFPSPLAEWIKQPKYTAKLKEAFHSETAKQFFNTDYLDAILNEHLNGKSNMQKIFTIYTFILWYDIYFNQHAEVKTTQFA